MTEEEAIQDIKTRAAAAKKWQKVFEILLERGVNKQEFCRRHSIQLPWLSRILNLKEVPIYHSIRKVHAAFAAENIDIEAIDFPAKEKKSRGKTQKADVS